MHSKAESNIPGITNVRPEALDVRRDLIPKLLNAWDEVYNLSDDWFEELIFDRLIAMGLQPIRLGAANRKDGGIDVIFWSCGLFPMLGAVQVKHHRTPNKRRVPEQFGISLRECAVTTSTSVWSLQIHHLPNDAKFESEKSGSPPIQLRDGQALRKWIADDFEIEETDFAVRTIEVCKGFGIDIPKFR